MESLTRVVMKERAKIQRYDGTLAGEENKVNEVVIVIAVIKEQPHPGFRCGTCSFPAYEGYNSTIRNKVLVHSHKIACQKN